MLFHAVIETFARTSGGKNLQKLTRLWHSLFTSWHSKEVKGKFHQWKSKSEQNMKSEALSHIQKIQVNPSCTTVVCFTNKLESEALLEIILSNLPPTSRTLRFLKTNFCFPWRYKKTGFYCFYKGGIHIRLEVSIRRRLTVLSKQPPTFECNDF